MSAERIIGVDFGTSTSVIRVKRYESGKPLGEMLETKEVVFGGSSTMVPTLIMKKNDDESVVYYGYEAQKGKNNFTNFYSFKVELESEDMEKRARARKLTEEFLKFMAKQYKAQSNGGHLGNSDDKERTIISYPVKWSEETKKFMIDAAKIAGFPNVTGMDEAQAAIHAVTVQSTDYLKQHGLLTNGVSANVLLIDMGAGTTDLVLCRYVPAEKSTIEVLNTWPKSGDILFGGKEIDNLLQNFFRERMDEKDAQKAFKRVGTDKFKSWKEETVSPALQKSDSVSDFLELDNYVEDMEIDMEEYCLDRKAFENCLKDYLKQLPELINGCLQDAGMNGSDVDLVIVTGGHSQWYFVREMLAGKMPQFGEVGLTKIQNDESRIIPITRPQETVALGLVYSPIPVKVVVPETTPKPDPKPTMNILDKVLVVGGDIYLIKSDKKVWSSGYLGNPMETWENMRSIILRDPHDLTFVGLREDGTVVVSKNESGRWKVDSWKDIRSIACDKHCIIGVKEDGSVMQTTWSGLDRLEATKWNDMRTIVLNPYALAGKVAGLRKDGTVAYEEYSDLKCWKNICAIVSVDRDFAGLRKDGTVVASGYARRFNVENWSNIIAIAGGDNVVGGLRENGTVVVACSSCECRVSEWNNIIAIACGRNHIVGLKKDGTVVATGSNGYGQCNVSEWKDIIAIKAVNNQTVGIRKDGRVIYTTYHINTEYKTNLFGKRVIKSQDVIGLSSKITPVSIF